MAAKRTRPESTSGPSEPPRKKRSNTPNFGDESELISKSASDTERYDKNMTEATEPAATKSAAQQDNRSEAQKKNVKYMADHYTPEQWEDLISKGESEGRSELAQAVSFNLRPIPGRSN